MNKKIVIVGLGLIGGSLAKAFQKYSECTVAGIDRDPEVLKAALGCGAIDKIGDDGDIRGADLLYLCLYPQADIDFIASHAHLIPSSCLVTDTCGIKSEICRHLPLLAEKHGFPFVGGHPMAGKEQSGFAASDADLFLDASYLIVPCGAPQPAVDMLKAVAVELHFGGTVVTTPEHHDQMIAFTSQLPHVLACAYVMSPRCPEHNGFSAGSYRDVSRVANINEQLWAELFIDNRKALSEELDTLITNITDIKEAVAKGDAEALRVLLRRGRLIKERLGE
ncbi:prephenate dehydrogenase [Caproiciproducens sp. R1]|uniref:prephenate dehydrogenase n=1 Tax=Caproiciproducens sp. R1 TaxID=3435000 RepID=UPI0040332DD3